MSVEIVVYKTSHGREICAHNKVDSSFFWSQAEVLEGEKHAFTVLYYKQPMISTGICELWDGVGEAWMLADNDIAKHPLVFARLVKTHLIAYMDKHNFRRVQAHVRSDWKPAHRFARFCEMKKEGRMPRFGPEGGEYTRYARVI